MAESFFGDYEPEDAWDADDPTPLLVVNLYRRLHLLGELRRAPDDASIGQQLNDIAARLASVIARTQRGDDPARDMRIRLLSEDLATLRARP